VFPQDAVTIEGETRDIAGVHAAIAKAAGHPGIWRLILQVKLQLDRYRRLTLPVPGRMTRVVDEHAAVVAAIAAQEATAAGAAMAAHLDGLSASIRDVRELNPKYFEMPPEA
jgi:DNA-binding GntR family transcriptional regulator